MEREYSCGLTGRKVAFNLFVELFSGILQPDTALFIL